MITEDYVSFEVAKLLKEKGFDGECSKFYMPTGNGRWKYAHHHDFDISDRIDCPTHQMAMKWLREKDIHIVVYPSTKKPYALYMVDIGTKTLSLKEGHLRGVWNTYEEAVEAALLYALKNLI